MNNNSQRIVKKHLAIKKTLKEKISEILVRSRKIPLRRRCRLNITTTLHAQNPQRMANPIEKSVRVETLD